jgi:REP element-mobilizing transposase RayT
MPAQGHCWWHVILSTHASWLPGDPRGFRSRCHRLHSSGHYHNPPPAGEHDRLYRHNFARSGPAREIPQGLRSRVGQALLKAVETEQYQLLALAVSGYHAHLLIELPTDPASVKRMVGRLKQRSSHAAREAVAGKLWAKGGRPIRIVDQAHHRRTFYYILGHREQGAWVWSFRDGE